MIYQFRLQLPNGALANTSLYYPADDPPQYDEGSGVIVLGPVLGTGIKPDQMDLLGVDSKTVSRWGAARGPQPR